MRIDRMRDDAQRLCDILDVDYDAVLYGNREYSLVYRRIIIAKYLHDHYPTSTVEIGKVLKKHHTTILHYMKLYDSEYEYNSDFRELAESVMKEEKDD